MNEYKIMVVDDEPDILDLLEKALSIEGFPAVIKIDTGRKAINACKEIQPDVIIVCDPKKVKHFGIYGAPDFVLEVLSKSTKKRDITLKLMKYMEAGVKEYWAIDTDKRILIVYLAEEDAIPHVYPLEGEAGVQIYEGRLRIDLGKINRSIDRFDRLPGMEEETQQFSEK